MDSCCTPPQDSCCSPPPSPPFLPCPETCSPVGPPAAHYGCHSFVVAVVVVAVVAVVVLATRRWGRDPPSRKQSRTDIPPRTSDILEPPLLCTKEVEVRDGGHFLSCCRCSPPGQQQRWLSSVGGGGPDKWNVVDMFLNGD